MRKVLFLITCGMVKFNKEVLQCWRKGKGIKVKFSVKQHRLKRFVMAFPIRKVGLCFHCFTTFSWAPLSSTRHLKKATGCCAVAVCTLWKWYFSTCPEKEIYCITAEFLSHGFFYKIYLPRIRRLKMPVQTNAGLWRKRLVAYEGM